MPVGVRGTVSGLRDGAYWSEERGLATGPRNKVSGLRGVLLGYVSVL